MAAAAQVAKKEEETEASNAGAGSQEPVQGFPADGSEAGGHSGGGRGAFSPQTPGELRRCAVLGHAPLA